MAYMVERNSKGKPFQNQWLFESHLRSFGYFWVSLSALASSGPQLQKQLAYKSWLGTSGPDCHLTPKTEHLQKRKFFDLTDQKTFRWIFPAFPPLFPKTLPFPGFTWPLWTLQTILNRVESSAIIFQISFPIGEYQICLISNDTGKSNINSGPVSIVTKIFDQHPSIINSFSINVQIMDKPGSWFLLPKCLKTPVEDWH